MKLKESNSSKNIFSGDELIVLLIEIFTNLVTFFLLGGVSPKIENCLVIPELILANHMDFEGGDWNEAVDAFQRLSAHSWPLSS